VSKDTRMPVWQGIVKGKLVTIYDMEAYEESLRLYPDEPSLGTEAKSGRVRNLTNSKPAFAQKKPAACYNWIVKLDQPLKGRAG